MNDKVGLISSLINFNILLRLPVLLLMIILIFYIDELKEITITQLFQAIGATIAIWLLYLRFKTTDDIKKIQEEQFHLNNQYKNFLETSKLLTDKESTIETKISAIYLLYDYAKNYPNEIEKVYQLLGEYIKPLLKCINKDCNNIRYSKFINCDLDKANFNQCSLNKTLFLNSDLTDTKFENVDLNKITFEKCIKEPKNE